MTWGLRKLRKSGKIIITILPRDLYFWHEEVTKSSLWTFSQLGPEGEASFEKNGC